MNSQNPETQGYAPPKFTGEIRLQLSRNETTPAFEDPGAVAVALAEPETLCRYPDRSSLRELIAGFVDVDPDRIVVTAGGDDALDRVMKVLVGNGRSRIVGHSPSFEMIDIYADQNGADLVKVPWPSGEFPAEEFISRIDSSTAAAVIVSPNNPTGGLVSADQIAGIASCASDQGAMILVDNAYIEFADEDPTPVLTGLDNVLVVRTFSKAWGLAGLRIGYLIAPDKATADRVRAVPGPYPVSGLSIAIAAHALKSSEATMRKNVAQIKNLRDPLRELIEASGGSPLPSGGNFVLAGFPDARTLWKQLSTEGVGVRIFPDNEELADRLRITIPHSVSGFLELVSALSRITGIDPEPHKQAAGGVVFDEAEARESPASKNDGGSRKAALNRKTKETDIDIDLCLDGTGRTEIETGIGFLDHMLTALAFHSGMDLKLICKGDLEVDDHHTVEDCALALGSAIDSALGRRSGIKRFGYAYAPLDEALARTVIDLSGRPWPEINLNLQRESIGQWACENITHFFQSLAMSLKCSLHVDVVRGCNDHHRAEAAFKSLAKALGQAITASDGDVPSTKGVL